MSLRIAELKARANPPEPDRVLLPVPESTPEQDYRRDTEALFAAMDSAPTWRERAEIRTRAHAALNRYLDRKFAEGRKP